MAITIPDIYQQKWHPLHVTMRETKFLEHYVKTGDKTYLNLRLTPERQKYIVNHPEEVAEARERRRKWGLYFREKRLRGVATFRLHNVWFRINDRLKKIEELEDMLGTAEHRTEIEDLKEAQKKDRGAVDTLLLKRAGLVKTIYETPGVEWDEARMKKVAPLIREIQAIDLKIDSLKQKITATDKRYAELAKWDRFLKKEHTAQWIANKIQREKTYLFFDKAKAEKEARKIVQLGDYGYIVHPVLEDWELELPPKAPEPVFHKYMPVLEKKEYGTPGSPYIISMPGWDDIIKIKPRGTTWNNPEIAKEDWEIYHEALRGKDPEMALKRLGNAKYYEIKKRTERIERLKASPTPEIAKSVAKVMTAIDDSEDLLSTGLVIGRTIWRNSKWVATKVGSKLFGPLGWALTIRDLMEIGGLLWKFMPTGRGTKKKSFDILNPRSWKKQARMKRALKFLRGKVGVGAVLEAAQASETVLGVGLQIGPIIGATQDVAFGSIKAARGKTVTINWPTKYTTAGEYERVARGMAGAAMITVQDTEQRQDTHMLALIALLAGLQTMQPVVNNEEMIRRSDEIMGYAVPHYLPWEPMTREILRAYDIDPDAAEPHLLPGSPIDVSFGELAEFYAQSGNSVLQNFRSMFPSGIEAGFASSTLQEIMMGCYNADLPPEEWIDTEPEYELDVETQFIMETIESGARPPDKSEWNGMMQKTEYCMTDIQYNGKTVPGIKGEAKNYDDALLACAQDYERIRDALGTKKIGTELLEKLIYCRFGSIMNPEAMPKEIPI